MAEQDARVEKRIFVETEPFTKWMVDVLMRRGFDHNEASEAGNWAAQTASYEVETHGARKLFHLLDHEVARSGSCVPQAQYDVLLPLPSLEVWDGRKKLGPAIARMAQARSVEMAKSQGMGIVFVRDCNHFGWGPAYALELLTDELLIGNACQGAIPIVTPIGGTDATTGSNAIAITLNTGVEQSGDLGSGLAHQMVGEDISVSNDYSQGRFRHYILLVSRYFNFLLDSPMWLRCIDR